MSRKLADEQTLTDIVSKYDSDKFRIHVTMKRSYELEEVIFKAFRDYHMMEWLHEGMSSENQDFGARFHSRLVESLVLASGGFLLTIENKQNHRIIAGAQVSYESPSEYTFIRFFQQLRYFTLVIVWNIFFGRIGLPWHVFYSPFSVAIRTVKRYFALEEFETVRLKALGPTIPHLYLIQVATDPDFQGHGLGKTLLNCVADIADHFCFDVYLETDTIRLCEYYKRNDYNLVAEFDIPDGESPFRPNFGMYCTLTTSFMGIILNLAFGFTVAYLVLEKKEGIRLARFIGSRVGRSVGILRNYRQNAEKLAQLNSGKKNEAISTAKDLDKIAREIRMAVWMARPGALVRMGPGMGMSISHPPTPQEQENQQGKVSTQISSTSQKNLEDEASSYDGGSDLLLSSWRTGTERMKVTKRS